MTDYSAMSDFKINKRVAELLNIDAEEDFDTDTNKTVLVIKTNYSYRLFDPCNKWEDAGRIMEDYEFGMKKINKSEWVVLNKTGHLFHVDNNPRRAICIVFLMMNEGK